MLKIVKVAAWIVSIIVVVLLLAVYAVQLPSVQNKIIQKIVSNLQEKLGTNLSMGKIRIDFPKTLVIEDFYIEDQKKDTLLFAGNLFVDTDLWGLLRHRIELDKIRIKKLRGYISRSELDSAFNFDFVVNAFTNADTSIRDSTSSSWDFVLGKVSMDNVRFQFDDSLGGNFIAVRGGILATAMDKFDLTKSIFKLDKVSFSNLNVAIIQTKRENSSDTVGNKTNKVFDWGIKDLELYHIDAKYENLFLGQHLALTVDNLKLDADDINLDQHIIDIPKLSIENTFLSYQITKHDSVEIQDQKPDTLEKPWQVKVDNLHLVGVGFQYYDFTKPSRNDAIDFNHLWVSQCNADIEDFFNKGLLLQSRIKNISFFEKSGFSIRALKTDLTLTEHDLSLRNLFIASSNSRLHIDGSLNFSSVETLKEEYAKAQVNINMDSSFLAVRDLLYFQPHVFDSIPVHVPNAMSLALQGKVHGTVNNLVVENLYAKTLNHTMLQLHGAIAGLPQVNTMMMNVVVREFYTTQADIQSLLKDSSLEASVRFPEWIQVTGEYKGRIKDGAIQSSVTSSAGRIHVNANINLDSTSARQGYAGELKLDSLDLGHVLKNNNLGKTTLEANVRGTGWKMENINTNVEVRVQNLAYQHYNYRNIELKGSMKSYFFEGSLFSHDKNFDFNLIGDLNYSQDVPHYHLTAELKSMDLKALHLAESTLKARGKLSVDLATRDFKSVNGDLAIRDVAIYNGTSLYKVDSLLFASVDQEGQTSIKVRSDLISGSFTGTMNLFDLPQTLKRYFNTYFFLQDSTMTKDTKPQNFAFSLEVKKTKLLTDIIFPKLTSFSPGVIKGDFNSVEKQLHVNVTMNKIVYDGIQIDSGSIRIQSDKKSLDYKIAINNFKTKAFQIPSLSWTGIVASDSLKTKLEILDSLSKEKYVLGGVFYSTNKEFQFRFLPGQTMLNYDAWSIPDDNYIRFDKSKIQAHNLTVSHNGQSLFVRTASAKDSSLSVGFRQFDVEQLGGLVSGSKQLMSGRLDGDLYFLRSGGINALLKLDSLTVLKQAWGDISLHANYGAAQGKTSFTLAMNGANDEVHAEGDYVSTPATEGKFNMRASISKLNLQILEPLTFNQLKEMKGTMKGDLNFTGALAQPRILGSINFSDAHFKSSYLNSSFLLKNETIQFTQQGIQFNNFSIVDASNNTARLNGLIHTSAFTNFTFDMSITAKAFELLNTKEGQNDLFYGKVDVNTQVKLTGSLEKPVVNMDLSFTDGSTFTYIVPQSDKGVLEQKGIVEFVDRDAVKDPFLSGIKLKDTIRNKFLGVELNANIELSNKVALTIIIDPVAGDKLAVQGDANLSFEMNPSGDMQLAGRYEISRGTYNLSFYKLVKREFSIEKGSTITWFGDPLNARMDIHAVYNVETAPIELLANQLNSSNSEELNQYKQRLPFQVFLNINGELLTPDITFQLGMPVDKRNVFGGNVYARIQDINTRESDLNRQVFALLLLKRFVSDNPLENQSSSLAGNARRSVSRLLTEQLNQLSHNIKGVNLNFDLRSDEDYTTGVATGNTKLQVGVSQNLFNDRLVVKVAGNVNIEGEDSSQQTFTDYLGDLALEFKVTNDGRLRLTGFRNSNYDMIDGELIQTGAGFIYVKEYNFLKELFKANANDK